MLVQSLYFSHKFIFLLQTLNFLYELHIPREILYSSCKLYILGTMLPFLWHETYIEGKWTQTLYLLFSSWDISLSLIWPKRDVSLTCRGRKENISCSLASFCEIAPKASDESRTYIDAHDDWFVQVPTSQGQSCVQMPYPSARIDLQFSCKKQD